MSEVITNTQHRFLIFRHGLATKSKTGYGEQILSAPLLDEAIPVIERLAEYLKNEEGDFQYCSELLRCRQTAEIVTRSTGKTFTPDARINEYNQEPFSKLTERVENFLEETIGKADILRQQNPGSQEPVTIWICTHGAVIAAIKHLLIDGSFSQEFELDYSQSGELLKIWKKKLDLVSFN